jgi:hypothetical protein
MVEVVVADTSIVDQAQLKMDLLVVLVVVLMMVVVLLELAVGKLELVIRHQ